MEMHGIKKLQNHGTSILYGGGEAEHEKHDLFQKGKKRIDISRVITEEKHGAAKQKKRHFHAFVDTARFAGGARSLERRAVTGA
jgi:hypothetical protein